MKACMHDWQNEERTYNIAKYDATSLLEAGLKVGLATNITYNRLNMFPEIPDICLDFSLLPLQYRKKF